VLTALPVKARIMLNQEISQRISDNALHYLSPTGATEPERIRVLKSSLHSVLLRNADNKLSLHLINVLFDYMSISTSVATPVSDNSERYLRKPETEKVVKVSLANSKQKNKIKVIKSRKSEMSCSKLDLNEIPNDLNDSEESRMEVIPNDLIPEQEISASVESNIQPDSVETITSPVTQDPPVRSKKRKIGSASPASPSHQSVVECPGTKKDAHVVAPNKVKAQEVFDTYWSMTANLTKTDIFEKWMTMSPSHFNIKCHVEAVGLCSGCIRVLLLTPISDCNSMQCDKEHDLGLFPHCCKQVSKDKIHADDEPSLDHEHLCEMFNKKVIPSLFYVMTHDRTAKLVVALGKSKMTLNKTVDYYLDLHLKRKS